MHDNFSSGSRGCTFVGQIQTLPRLLYSLARLVLQPALGNSETLNRMTVTEFVLPHASLHKPQAVHHVGVYCRRLQSLELGFDDLVLLEKRDG